MFTQGTFTHTLWRGVMAILAFGIPLVAANAQGWTDITVGSILFMIAHYAEGQYRAS